MKNTSNHSFRLFVAAGFVYILFFFPTVAHAYLDPGSANYTIQMLIAAAISGGFLIKSYWAKLKSFFTPSSSRDRVTEETTDDSPNPENPAV